MFLYIQSRLSRWQSKVSVYLLGRTESKQGQGEGEIHALPMDSAVLEILVSFPLSGKESLWNFQAQGLKGAEGPIVPKGRSPLIPLGIHTHTHTHTPTPTPILESQNHLYLLINMNLLHSPPSHQLYKCSGQRTRGLDLLAPSCCIARQPHLRQLASGPAR